MPKPIIQNNPGTGNSSVQSSAPKKNVRSMSEETFKKYDQEYKNWKKTGKYSDGFSSWMNQDELDLYKNIKSGSGRSARSNGSYYYMDNDTYDKYGKEYANWKSTNKYSDDFASWKNDDDLNAYKAIRGSRSQQDNAFDDFRYSLNDDIVKAVQDKYKSQWGDKYYYDITDADDLARMNAGQMPKYLAQKYKDDPYDRWLYENNLPSTKDFNDMYSQAVIDYNEQQQTRSGQLQNIINSLDQFDKQRAAFLQGKATGKTPEEMLATGDYDAFNAYYKEPGKEETNPYKARQNEAGSTDYSAFDKVYDALYSDDPNKLNEALTEDFWNSYSDKEWQKYLNQKLAWNESDNDRQLQIAADQSKRAWNKAKSDNDKQVEKARADYIASLPIEEQAAYQRAAEAEQAAPEYQAVTDRLDELRKEIRKQQHYVKDLGHDPAKLNAAQTEYNSLQARKNELEQALKSEEQIARENQAALTKQLHQIDAEIARISASGWTVDSDRMQGLIAQRRDINEQLHAQNEEINERDRAKATKQLEAVDADMSTEDIEAELVDLNIKLAGYRQTDGTYRETEENKDLIARHKELESKLTLIDTAGRSLQNVNNFLAENGGSDEIADSSSWSSKARHNYKVLSGQVKTGGKLLKLATPEEIAGANAAAAQGEEAFNAYFKDLETVLKYRSTQERSEKFEEMAQQDAVGASVLSVGMGVLSAAEGAGNILSSLNTGYGNAVDMVYAGYMTSASQAIRNTVSEDIILNNSDQSILPNVSTGQIYSFLYQSGMSMLDSAARIPLGTAGLAIAGLSAADSTILEQLENGATTRQAVALGVVAGFAEFITEKVSLEQLLTAKTSGTLKQFLWETAKQAITEGSEEIASEVINIIAEAIILEDNDFTWPGILSRIGEAGLGGLVSGLGFGAIGQTVRTSRAGGFANVRTAQSITNDILGQNGFDKASGKPGEIGKFRVEYTNAVMKAGLSEEARTNCLNLMDQMAADAGFLATPEGHKLAEQLKGIVEAESSKAQVRVKTFEAEQAKNRQRLSRMYTNLQNLAEQARSMVNDPQGHSQLYREFMEASQEYQEAQQAEQNRQEAAEIKLQEAERQTEQKVADAVEKAANDYTQLTATLAEARGADALVALGDQLAKAEAVDSIETDDINSAKAQAMENGDTEAYNLLDDLVNVQRSGNEEAKARFADEHADLMNMLVGTNNVAQQDVNANNNIQEEMVNANSNGRNGQPAEGYTNEVPALRQGWQAGDLDQRVQEGELQGYSGEQGESSGVQESVRRSAEDAQRTAAEEGQGRIIGKIHSWTKDKINQLNNAIQSVNKDVRAQGILKAGDLTACEPDQVNEQSKYNAAAAEKYTGVDETFFYNLAKAAGIELDGITPGDKAASFIRNMGGHVMEIFAKAHEDAHRVKVFRDAVHNIMMGFDQDIRGSYFQNYLGIRNVDLGGISYEQASAYNRGEADINEGLEGLSEQERREILQQRKVAADMAEEFQCDVVGAYVLYKATDGSMLGWDQLGMGPSAAAYFTLLSDVLNGQQRNADGTANTEAKALIIHPDSEENDGLFPGVTYVNVLRNQRNFDNVPVNQYSKVAEKILNQYIGTVIGGENNKAFFNGTSREEYLHPRKKLTSKKYNAKMRASSELSDIVDASSFIKHSENNEEHPNIKAINGWDYYETIFRIGNRLFKGQLDICNTVKGKLFYDISKIKDITENLSSRITASSSLPGDNNNIQDRARIVNDVDNIQAPEQGAFSLPENTFMDDVVNPGGARQQEQQQNKGEVLTPSEDGQTRFSIRTMMHSAGLDMEKKDGVFTVSKNGKSVNNITTEDLNGTQIGAIINRAVERGFIKQQDADTEKTFVRDLVNMMIKNKDADMVWAFAGSQVFSAITNNSDAQYSKTVDFTTICRKTQAIINAMSERMVELQRGLTDEEILNLQNELAQRGEAVPCPVCYVFSRWTGIGGVLERIKNYQQQYADINVARAALANHTDPNAETWLTKVRLAKGYKPVPNDVLFDLNRGGDFASKYPLTWKYRTTRGPALGKAMTPYAEMNVGDVVQGMRKSPQKIKKGESSPFQTVDGDTFGPEALKELLRSEATMRQQNLLGGLRYQSTSDFRTDYALDYLLSFFDVQAVGGKIQTYSKQADGARLLAAVGADVNLSVMPKGKGWKLDADGKEILDTSSVTGMDFKTAVDLKNKYDNAQLIMVGINDDHIRISLANSDIGFVIPYHASGGRVDFITQMARNLGENVRLSEYQNYEDCQTDTIDPNATPEQNAARDLRSRILMGKAKVLSEADQQILDNNPILHNLYNRFYVEGVDPDCYGVKLKKAQAATIMPFEYWDTNSTIDTADENGKTFINYCESLGLIPRFSGKKVVNGKVYNLDHGNFTEMKGYWKTLIDRPMYNNDGSYHVQQKVNVSGVTSDMLSDDASSQFSIRPPTGLTRSQRAQMFQWDRERLDNQLRNMKASERAAVLREREKMQQRQDREKYGSDVVKRSRDLMKWMTSPNVKEGKYVPDFFKDAVSEVLQGIDLGSNDRVGGQKVQSWRRSLMNLATTLQQYKAHQEGRVQDGRFEGMEMDLPDGFVEDFTDLANSITEEGTNFLQDMDADRLRRLDKSIAVLQSGIRNANRMHANARYATVSEAADATIQEQEGRRKYKNSGVKVVEAVRNLVNSEMLDLESYAQRLGDAGGSVMRSIANGFLKGTTHIKEAQEFFENAREKDGITKKDVHSWTKNTVTQQLDSGETISMTEGQLMNLYALSARQQAMSHILQGGIELAYNKSSKGNQNRAYQLTYGDLDNLFSHLSDKQKRFVADLQRYLSETASGWGNEVSQELYGIDMYGEEFYWPIRSAKAGLATQDPEKVRAFNAIQNSSFTNAVIRNASNPITLDDCVQTFCDHVAQMANYNGMAVPIGDAMKWFNYKSKSEEGAPDWNRSVKRSITDVMGKDGTGYFINLIKDINGLSEGGTGTNLPSALVANTKKAAVAAKIRVMIQQPTAVVRAMSMINPKYFAGFDDLHLKDVVNEMQENAPIAWWKAQGNFDIGTGKSMRDIISGDASAYENFVNATMAGAGAMDDLGWSWIWNAVKREQKARHPGMTDEQLMPAIVDRFTDVINKTQVIDTVVHRSQIMRSKDSAVKQSTAFMSEPIKTFNLLHNALNDVIEGRPGAKKRLGKTVAAVAGSWALNAAVLALHDALKYRDEDDDLWDLIQQYWKDNFIDNFNQLNAIPYIKDVIALAQGESLERMDMSAIADLIDSAQAIGKYLKTGSTGYTDYGLTRKFMTALGNVFGTPLTGLLADAELVVNAVAPGSILTKKTKNWDKADALIEQGINKKQARGLMKNYDGSTNASKALSILTYDGNRDGKPDFDKQQQDLIAEILGISYAPEKDETLEAYARKNVDSYMKKKEKLLEKGEITEEQYDGYQNIFDTYFELLG